MTTPINDGGPAFPGNGVAWEPETHQYVTAESSQGMSLRDWFAGQALPSIIAAIVESTRDCPEVTQMDVLRESVIKAFRTADMAIAAREKGAK